MKELKNKSSVYIFPIIFYKLLEEGADEKIINHVYDTYLSDENDNFILILDRKNIVNGSDLEDETIADLLNCKSIINKDYDNLNDNLISIEIVRDNDLNNIVNIFTKGKYSELDDDTKRDVLDFGFNYCTLNFYIKVGYVLYKSAEYREFLAEEYGMTLKEFPEDQELDDIVNLKDELYDGAKKETIKEAYTEV